MRASTGSMFVHGVIPTCDTPQDIYQVEVRTPLALTVMVIEDGPEVVIVHSKVNLRSRFIRLKLA